MYEVLLLAVFIVFLLTALWTLHRANAFLRATITPLASIIGSGFLVIAPLLYSIGGALAPLYMMVILIVAFLTGAAIRLNIRYEREIPKNGLVSFLERGSNLILSFAYVVSVAFYLRLMSSFLLSISNLESDISERLITSVVLMWIGISGYRGGLASLEGLEGYSVSIKMAVIASLIAGLFMYNLSHGIKYPEPVGFSIETLRYLSGMLLVVQGFETSKYLGHTYDAEMRIRSMKLAQLLSGLVYVGFILLVLPLLERGFTGGVEETLLVEISREISLLLPYLLVLGAVMSQFSASVADTIGSGGLLSVETGGKVNPKMGYLIVSLLGIILVWSSNIFGIISLASRAFALYYAFQTLIAVLLSYRFRRRYLLIFVPLFLILCFIVVFAKSLESRV
jgi:hypothetical protein